MLVATGIGIRQTRIIKSVAGIECCGFRVSYTNSGRESIELEIVIDILLIAVEILPEDFNGIVGCPIDIIGSVFLRQGVVLEVTVADEHGRRRVVESVEDADYIIVLQAGYDAVGKGRFGFCHVILHAVDEDRRHGSTLLRLDTDIGVVEERSDGRVNEILVAARGEEAVGGGVADFGIGDLGIHIDEDESVEGVVMNTAVEEVEFRSLVRVLRLDIKADIAAADFGKR